MEIRIGVLHTPKEMELRCERLSGGERVACLREARKARTVMVRAAR